MPVLHILLLLIKLPCYVLSLSNIFFSPIEFISHSVLICNPPKKENTALVLLKLKLQRHFEVLAISV